MALPMSWVKHKRTVYDSPVVGKGHCWGRGNKRQQSAGGNEVLSLIHSSCRIPGAVREEGAELTRIRDSQMSPVCPVFLEGSR